jgi:hypothetical protein
LWECDAESKRIEGHGECGKRFRMNDRCLKRGVADGSYLTKGWLPTATPKPFSFFLFFFLKKKIFFSFINLLSFFYIFLLRMTHVVILLVLTWHLTESVKYFNGI